MERRRYARHSIFWDAELTGRAWGPWAFEIRDFCEGGLLLTPATRTTGSTFRRNVSEAEPVVVRLLDPLSGERRQTKARIVRINDSGIGVSFTAPEPQVYAALMAVSAGRDAAEADDMYTSTATDSSTRVPQRQALAACRTVLETYLKQRLGTFLEQTDRTLFETARDAASMTEQTVYLDGQKLFRTHRNQLERQFMSGVLSQWDALGRFQLPSEAIESGGQETLALIEDTAFEQWLARSELITKAESRCMRRLRFLQRRLSLLVRTGINEPRNPISPAAICYQMTVVLETTPLEPAVVLKVYELFGRTVMAQLGALYDALNARLRELDVLPGLEEERHEIVRSAAPVHAASAPVTAAPGEDAEAPRRPLPPAAAPAPEQPPSSGIGRIYQDLLKVSSRWRSRSSGGDSTTASSASARKPEYETREVLQALGEMPVLPPDITATAAPSLQERVKTALGRQNSDKQLSEALERTVEILDNWFQASQRATTEPTAQHWLARLSELALKVQLNDGGFLDEAQHPIHDLVNAVARLDIALAASNPQDQQTLRRDAEQLLEEIAVGYNGNPAMLRMAAVQLDHLTQRPLRARNASIERVQQAAEGSQRVELAKKSVQEEIDRRIAGRSVHPLFLELVKAVWRNHLVLTQLRQGTDSEHWRQGLALMDRLIEVLGIDEVPPQRPVDVPNLLAQIDRQLRTTSSATTDVDALLQKIGKHLTTPAVASEALVPVPATPEEDAPRDSESTVAAEDLGRAKLLNIGDWMLFNSGDKGREPLRVAWINRDRSRYVFVDRRGVKTAELTVQELAAKMAAAEAEPGEALDAPLTERRWQDALLRLNEKLVHQSTHDSLTGVLDRKALERRLRLVLERPTPVTQQHVLCHFALDGFKVVNNTLGHGAGDELLQQVARLLREAVSKRGFVGRTGGDEFAVLLLDHDEKDGIAFAEMQRRIIKDRRFRIRDEHVSIATSVGLVPFTRDTHSLSELLKDSDGACFAAKNTGGNRIHVYRPDDAEMTDLRTRMEQASRLDKALAAGLLRLRCQRIAPLSARAGEKPHYEILVSLDGGGADMIRPQDFIPAAERFGRMPAVDRRIIRQALDWSRHNRSQFDRIAGLTINISSQSLNDDDFLKFIKQEVQFSRVPAEAICFEIAETTVTSNLAKATDLMRGIEEMGCRLALDDFGSGLSSYTYLRNLPVDFLKIDGEFIRYLSPDGADFALVRSINELGHHLGKRTIAEQVETTAVIAQLRSIGVDYAQGFAIAAPIPLERLGQDVKAPATQPPADTA